MLNSLTVHFSDPKSQDMWSSGQSPCLLIGDVLYLL
jgi:hypothetical protein